MHIRIRNVRGIPLSEGTTAGEHAYVKPGEVKEVPLELGKKWCSLGYATIELAADADVVSASVTKKQKTSRQPLDAHPTMGVSIEKEEVGNA